MTFPKPYTPYSKGIRVYSNTAQLLADTFTTSDLGSHVEDGSTEKHYIVKNEGLGSSPGVLQEVSSAFEPDRALFVAQSWPISADPNFYFTNISSALAQALSLTPTQDNPVVIILYPGTYPDPLVLVSNVHLFGQTPRAVRITGAVVWNPGAGVNAPQAAVNERIYTTDVNFASTITIDTTAKTGGLSVMDSHNIIHADTINHTGRVGGLDFYQTAASICSAGIFNNTAVIYVTACQYDSLDTFGQTGLNFQGQIFGDANFHDQSSGIITNSLVNRNVNLHDTSFIQFPNTQIVGTVTVDALATADIRDTLHAALVGPGNIDRNLTRIIGSLAAGINSVAINPPLPDANYSIAISQRTGIPESPIVTPVSGSVVNVTVVAAGNTWDISLLRE